MLPIPLGGSRRIEQKIVMAKYVTDTQKKRWVVIVPSRVTRTTNADLCPFCPGNEHLTPPEVYRNRDIRVVGNLFPITDIHEVIVHSPDHTKDIKDLPIVKVERLVGVYRNRYRAHTDQGNVIIYCNCGFGAGASLVHPHSQVVVIPKEIPLDTVCRGPVANIVEANEQFVTYCPDFSEWPYEMCLAPKKEDMHFGDTTDGEIPFLAQALQKALQKLAALNKDKPFGYNFYISHAADWFIRIIPRFVDRAGFELGTGISVNVVDPAEAAEILKKIIG